MSHNHETARRLNAVLRNDFNAFIHKSFDEVNPTYRFYSNWHVETLAWHLQQCAEGNIKRLIVTVPPRHLKSICASVALPAWLLGRNPALNVICVSYTNELAGKHARDFRSVVASSWYRGLFRKMRIDRRKNAELEVVTTMNGGRYATSVEGTLTGRGGDVIVIDDPIKPDKVMSEAERQRVNEWFDRTVYTRLNSKRDGVIIIVMQRLHEDDLVGHVLEKDDWTVLNIPAIAPEAMEYRVGERWNEVYRRESGALIDLRREGEPQLEQLKRMLGSYNFAAQYQQNPMPIEGNLVKRAWFRSYVQRPARDEFDSVVLSWDTANAAGELNDYSVCTVWGVQEERYYLLDVVRRKLDYPDLRRLAIQLARQHAADIVLVEDVGTGKSLYQDLHEEFLDPDRRRMATRVFAYRPDGDKEVRFAAQSAVIEQRRVYLPQEAPWLNEFMKELLGFPGAKHDDQVDSVELFLRFVNNRRNSGRLTGRSTRERSNRPRPQERQARFNARKYIRDLIHSNSNPVALF